MGTRNVALTDRQADLVERLVASGRYQNASEVLREGLRLIEGREEEDKARLNELRDAAHRDCRHRRGTLSRFPEAMTSVSSSEPVVILAL